MTTEHRKLNTVAALIRLAGSNNPPDGPRRDDAGSGIGDVVTNREFVFLLGKGARVNRGLRTAEQAQDFDSQRTLAKDRQRLRDQIDELMGLTL